VTFSRNPNQDEHPIGNVHIRQATRCRIESMAAKKASGKRTLIKPKGDARYIKRDSKGRIKESDDVGRSLKKDREKQAKTKVKSGYGDKGDQKKRGRAK
jgi:hypothetical protein